jgi:hypothetical protein
VSYPVKSSKRSALKRSLQSKFSLKDEAFPVVRLLSLAVVVKASWV